MNLIIFQIKRTINLLGYNPSVLTSSLLYSLAVVIERGTIILISFIASVSLEPEDFSQFGEFTIKFTAIAGYGTLGISLILIKFSAELRNGSLERKGLIRFLYFSSIFTTLLILILNFIGNVNYHFSLDYILLFSAAIALSSLTNTSSILLGFEAHKSSFLSALTFFISAFLLYVCAAQFVPSYSNLASVMVLSYSCYSLSSLYFVHKHLRTEMKYSILSVFKSLIEAKILKELLPLIFISSVSTGLIWFVSHNLLQKSNVQEHVTFLICLQWTAISTFVPSIFIRLIFPRMVAGNESNDSYLRLIKRLIVMSMILSGIIVCIALIVLIFSSNINDLYKNKPDISRTIFWFIIFSIPASLANLFGNQLVALGETLQWLFSSISGFALMLFVFLLINDNSALSYSLIMSSGYLLMIILSVSMLIRRKY